MTKKDNEQVVMDQTVRKRVLKVLKFMVLLLLRHHLNLLVGEDAILISWVLMVHAMGLQRLNKTPEAIKHK